MTQTTKVTMKTTPKRKRIPILPPHTSGRMGTMANGSPHRKIGFVVVVVVVVVACMWFWCAGFFFRVLVCVCVLLFL